MAQVGLGDPDRLKAAPAEILGRRQGGVLRHRLTGRAGRARMRRGSRVIRGVINRVQSAFNKVQGAFNKVQTAYRRIDHPEIKSHDLVIDVGCGGLPNPRADVACDSMPQDSERALPLQIDRPFVWADVTHLPFRTRAFDYSILS